MVLADVRLSGRPRGAGLVLGSTPSRFGFLVPYGRGDGEGAWYRAMLWDRDHQVSDAEPVGEAEIVDGLRQSMRQDLGVLEVGWHSRFHCEERQVPTYRYGRVLLAGDAAHVHTPMGGQGMNTGVQDAVNLAWKLDAALRGADDEVLDAYQVERHPVGAHVIEASGKMMRGITLRPRLARAVRDTVFGVLMRLPRTRGGMAANFGGLTIRYPAGPGDHEPGRHPRVVGAARRHDGRAGAAVPRLPARARPGRRGSRRRPGRPRRRRPGARAAHRRGAGPAGAPGRVRRVGGRRRRLAGGAGSLGRHPRAGAGRGRRTVTVPAGPPRVRRDVARNREPAARRRRHPAGRARPAVHAARPGRGVRAGRGHGLPARDRPRRACSPPWCDAGSRRCATC
ncbi:hypothetical protein GCM10025868_09280 [Angustibacter aerolatus]|uniref:FAD-binding domain-containing protein n=1 Tax=Angustibacter aerolatus TaxID=1162965 RepID=A0ABQ6JBZ0_9ACTN|nr:hypothetical protein GCM10025868_09280 [Angustibacter aerolatus]